MRTVNHCPTCGSAEIRIIATLNEERHARFVAYSRFKYGSLLENWLEEIPPVVVRCMVCGHYWYRHQPEPEQLYQMYSSGQPLTQGARPSREPSVAMIAEMARLYRLVVRGGESPTLLDYGSGFGRWARAAVKVGFCVTAFEPSTERGAEMQVPFELVHNVDEIRGRRFNSIHIEQVLEHVPNPLVTLEEIKNFCVPDTVVRITVPNMLRAPEGKNLWAIWPFDGKRPHLLAPYEHLHGFTPFSLNRLLARAGFKRINRFILWGLYPLGQIRYLLEEHIQSLGSTLRLVSPA
jgi:SAM-dependent methyltransferase